MVCVFGAGGPVGRKVYETLKDHYRLRLTDIAGIEDVVARGGRGPWPTWTEGPESPHEWARVDVTKYGEVEAALAGCDAAINLTVNRSEPALAFAINVGGAYNILKAAAAQGLKRVIHTGPNTRTGGYEGDYRYEYRIPDGVSMRPGTGLYGHTKHLSVEMATAMAEAEGLDVMTLLVSRLRPSDAYDHRDGDVVQCFSIAFEELGDPFLCALKAPECPHANEVFNICAALSMDKWRTDKSERLLGWKAKERFERFYTWPLPPGREE
jgi:nucleoside-diphosphate-sugar epimerase